MIRAPPSPSLFPYTTLFRSERERVRLPIGRDLPARGEVRGQRRPVRRFELDERVVAVRHPALEVAVTAEVRSEEHTSELQSRLHLVCRLLPEKKQSTHHSVD